MASTVQEQVYALHHPLISDNNIDNNKGFSALRRISTWLLPCLLWATFLFWIALLFVLPTIKFHAAKSNTSASKSTGGLALIMFAAPLLFMSVFGLIYLQLRSPRYVSRRPKISLWTYPLLVDGLLGVVSAAEVVLILAFIFYSVWFMANYVIQDVDNIKRLMEFPRIRHRFTLWQLWTNVIGLRLGFLGLVFMGFLLLPVARGSTLLRVIDIPFEHAVKYHVWLGHFIMALFTVHGLCFCLVWAAQGRLIEQLLKWKRVGVANLAGVISLGAGILIWLTSFGYVRKQYFELFFYTHQLYVVFIVFMAFHIGDVAFCICLAGTFLYLLDRFLRFCQSRRAVQVLASRVLPCGTFELFLAKPPGLPYHSLSFIFLCVPNLSWLQWHPFSVSSSPYDAQHTMSILIKPLGSWTQDLQKLVEETNDCPLLGVEGPYGHESDYYLKYETLVLVAGGIGVSPFIAVLRHLLHRVNMNQPGLLPREVILVWAVKSSKELSMLNLVQPGDGGLRFNLSVHAYVTREAQPDAEEGGVLPPEICKHANKPRPGFQMSTLVASYNNYWMAAYTIVSMAGFFLVEAVLRTFILGPQVFEEADNENSVAASSSWAARVAALLVSMICGVVVFGGLVLVWRNNSGGQAGSNDGTEFEKPVTQGGVSSNLVGPWNTVYGRRPDLKEMFGGIVEKRCPGNVGVLVCGPETLQSSVAAECRAYNTQRQKDEDVVFHYHSVSFDL